MIHPGLAALKHRDKEEYAAGYRARFSEIPDSEAAHHCWGCGWEDADTEAIESARRKRASAEGREYRFKETWGNLFDSGEEARANGVPFEDERTEPWKEGWIAVDIKLWILAEREPQRRRYSTCHALPLLSQRRKLAPERAIEARAVHST